MKRSKRSGLLSPYSVLPAYYDEVYAIWRAFLGPARDEILRSHSVAPGRILDLGCGSGWQSVELARRGHTLVAVDPVQVFLAPLRETVRREGLPVDVRRGSLLRIPARRGERFDLVLATFDVLNHLRRAADLGPALAEIARVTAPGGHLLFDVNTPNTIASVSEHHRVVRLSSGGVSAETGELDVASGRATILRDWFLPVGERPRLRGESLFRLFRERYREVAWPRKDLLTSVRRAGFAVRMLTDANGWLSFLPEGSRWIVLARKRRDGRPAPR